MSDPRPTLLVFKELMEGDLLKMRAESNVSATGGGARDLRLPHRNFRTVMYRIFTETQDRRGREIRVAQVTYRDSGLLRTAPLEYWPATDARPAEDRVARVHDHPALGGRPPAENKGRIFVVFIKWDNNEVRVYYAYEQDLAASGANAWAPEIRSAIRHCMTETDAKNATRSKQVLPVQGYIDFTNGMTFCNATV